MRPVENGADTAPETIPENWTVGRMVLFTKRAMLPKVLMIGEGRYEDIERKVMPEWSGVTQGEKRYSLRFEGGKICGMEYIVLRAYMTPQLCAQTEMCRELIVRISTGTVSSQTGRRRDGFTGLEPPNPGLWYLLDVEVPWAHFVGLIIMIMVH